MPEIPEEIYEAALPCITDPYIAADSYRDVVDTIYPMIVAHGLREAADRMPHHNLIAELFGPDPWRQAMRDYADWIEHEEASDDGN